MGIFSTPKLRQPYVPPMGGADVDDDSPSSRSSTMLGGQAPASNDWLSRLAPTRSAGLPSDTGSDSPLAVRPDPNLVRTANPGADEPDTQIAQQRPSQPGQPRTPPPPLSAAERQAIAQPGRGYGVVPQDRLERGMTVEQRRVNRLQALQEIARTPPAPGAIESPLPKDWERTKPSEIVDDLKRAAVRHLRSTRLERRKSLSGSTASLA